MFYYSFGLNEYLTGGFMGVEDRFKNLIGTIVRTAAHSSNPAERPEDKTLFYNGFEEITVISKGMSDFPTGTWKIRLVTYRNREQKPTSMGKNCTFVAVAPDTVVQGVTTEMREEAGKQVGAIIINLYSDYTKDSEEVLICTGEIETETVSLALAS